MNTYIQIHPSAENHFFKSLLGLLLISIIGLNNVQLYGQAPNNDLCINAKRIIFAAETSSSGTGTTLMATNIGAPANCSGEVDNTNGGGLWYRFGIVNGFTYRVSTCNDGTEIDTEISLYSGDDCGMLTCIGDSDDDNNCTRANGTASSTITFTATDGDRKYIYIKGKNGASGNFQVDVTIIPNNAFCNGAEDISLNNTHFKSERDPIEFTTMVDAPVDCSGEVNNDNGGGLWYRFNTIEDLSYRVSTCNNGTEIDTEITVFSGDDCGALVCVEDSDDDITCTNSSGTTASTLTFEATGGGTRYVYVKGKNGATGNIQLDVSVVPTNIFCSGAQHIPLGTSNTNSVSGTIEMATTIDAPVDCSMEVENGNGGGLWYYFNTVSDFAYVVSTCNDGTEIDTEITLFSGDVCDALVCVEDSDDDPTCMNTSGMTASTISFTATSTGRRYIYVKGKNGAIGNFQLDILGTPKNDICSIAKRIKFGSEMISSGTGTTLMATNMDAPTDCSGEVDNTNGGGLWYRFGIVRGFTYKISTCNDDTEIDTEISLYSGNDCGLITCVGDSDDDTNCMSTNGTSSSTFTFTATDEDRKYIYVKGKNGAIGNFQVDVSIVPEENLPVELSYFRAEAKTLGNLIKWETLSEENTELHVLERSQDGIFWEAIAEQVAAGTSSRPIQYEALDNQPYSKTYYRLLSQDFDGSQSFSEIIQLTRSQLPSGLSISSVYPIPTDDQVFLVFESSKKDQVVLQLFDKLGKQLKTDRIATAAGTNHYRLDLSNVPNGTYFLNIQGASGREVRKIVKMN